MEKINIKSNVKGLELYSDQYPFRLSLRVGNFETETEYVKFIRNCEKLVRGCREYKEWRNYIIDVLGINTCMVTSEKMDECTIEVHHHIPSLFVFIKTIINKEIEQDRQFSTFDIALKTMELHFQNKVGYLTLIKSMHEKFHNGFLSIPKELVKGDFNWFLNEYSEYIDEEDLDVINQRLSINESNCSWTRNEYPSEVVEGGM